MAITVTSSQVRPVDDRCIVNTGYAGAALTVGYAGYLDASGYVQHADANAGETESRGVGIIISSPDGETSIAAGRACGLCVFGPVGGFSGMTPGEPVYVDKTVGLLTQTKPTGGAYQRAIGYAKNAYVIMVNPESGDPSSA